MVKGNLDFVVVPLNIGILYILVFALPVVVNFGFGDAISPPVRADGLHEIDGRPNMFEAHVLRVVEAFNRFPVFSVICVVELVALTVCVFHVKFNQFDLFAIGCGCC